MNFKSTPIVAFFLFLIIDAVFLYKYGERVFKDYRIILCLLGFYVLRLRLLFFLNNSKISERKWLLYGTLLLLFILSILVFHFIDPAKSHVDRWDAVVYWWDALFKGQFPYSARTRWGGFPSPLPVFQVICLPFYLIGEIGLCIFASTLLLIFLVKNSFKDQKTTFLVLFLILSSPAYWWEISVRSTLFINGVLILLLVIKLREIDLNSWKSIVLGGILAGLILSTRMIVIIPILVFLGSIFHLRNYKAIAIFGLILSLTFGLTFLPIIFNWGFEPFWMNNPILHHDNHMPRIYSVILLISAFIIGTLANTIEKNTFFVGIWLAVSALLFVSISIIKYGFYAAFFESYADFSYFILALPALIFSFCSFLKKD